MDLEVTMELATPTFRMLLGRINRYTRSVSSRLYKSVYMGINSIDASISCEIPNF